MQNLYPESSRDSVSAAHLQKRSVCCIDKCSSVGGVFIRIHIRMNVPHPAVVSSLDFCNVCYRIRIEMKDLERVRH